MHLADRLQDEDENDIAAALEHTEDVVLRVLRQIRDFGGRQLRLAGGLANVALNRAVASLARGLG